MAGILNVSSYRRLRFVILLEENKKANQQTTDTQEQKKIFHSDPEQYHRYKKMIENELNKRFKLVLRDTKESDEANAVSFSDLPLISVCV